MSKLLVKKLVPHAILPQKGTAGAAGYDLSAIDATVVPARGKSIVKTGLSWKCPPNTYGRIAPRSGLSWKHSISVGAGVIDEDYRGEVGVILFNHSDQDFAIKQFDRIAQLIIERIEPCQVFETDQLDRTERGEGGYGSTGGVEAMRASQNTPIKSGDTPSKTGDYVAKTEVKATAEKASELSSKKETQNIIKSI